MARLMPLIALTMPVLCGCAGSVIFGHTIGQDHSTATVRTVAPTVQAVAPTVPAGATDAKLRVITVAFTSDAMGKIEADQRFSRDALLAAVRADLRTHNLIDDEEDAAPADGSLGIKIDDFSNRPASNVVVLGYVLSNATLTGDIEVRDAAGRELRTFRIKANCRLSTSATGEPSQSLGPLYRKFADLTVGELTGIPFKEPEPELR